MSIADKLSTVAENVSKVYNAGKKEENNEFWNALLKRGNRSDLSYVFRQFPIEAFKPSCTMRPVNATSMFESFNTGTGNENVDLTNAISKHGGLLDTSRCTNFKNMFYFAFVKRVPELDTRAASDLKELFTSATRTVTIDKVVLKEEGSQTFYKDAGSNCFYNCSALVNVDFEGVIGNTIGFRESTKLSAQSMVNIFEHLSNDGSGKYVHVSQTAVNNADWSKTNYASFDALIATKSSWTVVYV